jgi:proline iminopeptidase
VRPDADPLEVVTDDGVRLWARSSGHGPSLVLCHGGPGLWDYLEPVAELLTRSNRVHRYDQRGCGRSEGADGPFTIDRFVADLDAVVDAAGASAAIVAGHSWGATLALLYALAHPDRVTGVVYMNGTGLDWSRWKGTHDAERERRLVPWEARHRDLAGSTEMTTTEERELIALRWATDYADLGEGLTHAREMLASGLVVNRRCSDELNAELDALDAADLERRCASLPIPVLVIEGERDPRPREALDFLVRSLPSVQRTRIDGAGHFPWVEAPHVVGDTLQGWLARIG